MAKLNQQIKILNLGSLQGVNQRPARLQEKNWRENQSILEQTNIAIAPVNGLTNLN